MFSLCSYDTSLLWGSGCELGTLPYLICVMTFVGLQNGVNKTGLAYKVIVWIFKNKT